MLFLNDMPAHADAEERDHMLHTQGVEGLCFAHSDADEQEHGLYIRQNKGKKPAL